VGTCNQVIEEFTILWQSLTKIEESPTAKTSL